MKEMILKFWKRWFGKEAAGQVMPAKWGRHFRASACSAPTPDKGMPIWWCRCETVKGASKSSFHRFKMIINMLMPGDGSECSRWKYIEESDFGRKHKSISNIQKKSLLLHP